MLDSVHINASNQLSTWNSDSPQINRSIKPRAQIYLKRNTISPKIINSIIYTKNLLQLKGISEEEIEEIVLEDDQEVQAHQILEQIGGIQKKKDFPVIYILNTPIGTVSDLEEWVISAKLDSLLDSSYHDNAPRNLFSSVEQKLQSVREQRQLLEIEKQKAKQQEKSQIVAEIDNSIAQLDKNLNSITSLLTARDSVRLRHIDTNPKLSDFQNDIQNSPKHDQARIVNMAFGTGIWCVKGMGSAISSVASYFNWNALPPKLSSAPKEYKDEKGSNYIEFEVIQINWYWRQQKRILRFSSDKFLRLNPFTQELRAVHKYHSIQTIVVHGKTFMTISFNDESQPEYYQSIDIESIVEILTSKAKPFVNIVVSYVSDL